MSNTNTSSSTLIEQTNKVITSPKGLVYQVTPLSQIKAGDRVAIHNCITGNVTAYATVKQVYANDGANIIYDGSNVVMYNYMCTALKVD